MATAINLLSAEQNRHLSETYRKAVGQKNRQLLLGFVIVILMIALSAFGSEVDGAKFAKNFWRFPHYFYEITPKLAWATLFPDLAEWFWGLSKWLRQLGETLLIAYLGTVTGAVAAFFLGFLASRNMAIGGLSQFVAKRFLEFCRTVPDIVFALIFVVSFGLGPLPGVLAIAIHTTGALGKLFSEVIENIDMKPVDGLKATGATWRQQVRFAAVPQVLSNFASYSLLRFEINVRGASVMGFVGAGGIGQTLLEYIRKFYYSDVSAVLILMIVTVMIIDFGTEKIRHRLVDVEGSR